MKYGMTNRYVIPVHYDRQFNSEAAIIVALEFSKMKITATRHWASTEQMRYFFIKSIYTKNDFGIPELYKILNKKKVHCLTTLSFLQYLKNAIYWTYFTKHIIYNLKTCCYSSRINHEATKYRVNKEHFMKIQSNWIYFAL